MEKLWREIYGAGILFFYYFKWPMILGYPALVYGLDYPRYWVLDLLWIYCGLLIVKDLVWKFVLKRSYCEEGSCSHTMAGRGPSAPRNPKDGAEKR